MTQSNEAESGEKIRIYVNSNSKMSRGKYAAAAVHAALTAAGVHPGLPVIVLGEQRDHITDHRVVIRDAGRTEVDPGTPTAGTDWEPTPRTREAAMTGEEIDDLLASSETAAWGRLELSLPVSYRARHTRNAHRAGFEAGLKFARLALNVADPAAEGE